MSASTRCPPDHPLMLAWSAHQATEDFENSKRWAAHPEHLQGSLWGLFMAGFNAATARAAALHESVNPASDQERHEGSPGAGAMGAVIEYRDLIRSALPRPAVDEGAVARIAALEKALSEAESEARRYAGFYSQSSDGRNTFLILADRIAALAAAQSPTNTAGD